MDKSKNGFSSKKVALGGILTALAVITLFFAAIAPTNRLGLYALSSFFVAVVIIENGIKTGWLFYIASSLLSFFIVQNKISLTPYIAFFGLYGIVKFYIEKINNLLVEYILKFLYFNLCLTAAYFFIREVLMYGVLVKFQLWILVAVLQIIFLVYDYVYTRFVQYYQQKLKQILKI